MNRRKKFHLVETSVYTEAFKQLIAAVFDGPHSVIIVAGPTGAGKSTLLNGLQRILIKAGRRRSRIGLLSHVHMILKAPPSGPFSIKNFEHCYLRHLQEPLTAFKEDPDAEELHPPSRYELGTLGTSYFLEKALQHRRPIATLLDEGQHLAMAGSVRKLRQNLEHFKSLANNGSVKHVFFGTYDLLAAAFQSDQIIRRNQVIHLRRYLANSEDAPHFVRILEALTDVFKMPFDFNPANHADFFYQYTLGCFGLVNDWFLRARCSYKDQAKISLNNMAAVALSGAELSGLMQQIVRGEAIWRTRTPIIEQLDLPFPVPSVKIETQYPMEADHRTECKNEVKKTKISKRKLNRKPICGIIEEVRSEL
jgi:energy-coupling factor transporter ATP-binding protein EcfA2